MKAPLPPYTSMNEYSYRLAPFIYIHGDYQSPFSLLRNEHWSAFSVIGRSSTLLCSAMIHKSAQMHSAIQRSAFKPLAKNG